MRLKILPLCLAAAAFCGVPPAAEAALSGGSYTVPVLATLNGGAAATGGTFSAAALNLGGPSYSLTPPAGGEFSLAAGAAPAVVIIDTASGTLGAARCYPVPFKPSLGHTNITFTGLTRQARVRIYTVSGELVRTLDKNDGGETLAWDVRNANGQRVASGVYVYTVKSGGQNATGKLMVIW